MSQTFTDDCFDPLHDAQTDLQNMENNFAALKSNFSGGSSPSNTVAGQLWFDTTSNILKIRNEANSAWLDLFDFGNIRVPPAAVKVITGLTSCNHRYTHPSSQQCTLNPLTVKPSDFANGAVMLPFSMAETESQIDVSYNAGNYTTIKKNRIYIPSGATRLRMAIRMYGGIMSFPAEARFLVGGNASSVVSIIATTYAWYTTANLNVSSLSGWNDLEVQGKSNHSSEVTHIQGFSFIWEAV